MTKLLEALRSSFASDHCDNLVDAPIFFFFFFLKLKPGKGKEQLPSQLYRVAFKPIEGSHS